MSLRRRSSHCEQCEERCLQRTTRAPREAVGASKYTPRPRHWQAGAPQQLRPDKPTSRNPGDAAGRHKTASHLGSPKGRREDRTSRLSADATLPAGGELSGATKTIADHIGARFRAIRKHAALYEGASNMSTTRDCGTPLPLPGTGCFARTQRDPAGSPFSPPNRNALASPPSTFSSGKATQS